MKEIPESTYEDCFKKFHQMSSAMHGSTTSWSVFTVVALVVVAVIYLRGRFRLRKVRQSEANVWRASAFLSGELSLAAAVASPLARLDHHWLTAHMVQHLVLMTRAAPLILLGEPAIMSANRLPEHFGTTGLDSLLRCDQSMNLGAFSPIRFFAGSPVPSA
jgi:putative membrane protein